MLRPPSSPQQRGDQQDVPALSTKPLGPGSTSWEGLAWSRTAGVALGWSTPEAFLNSLPLLAETAWVLTLKHNRHMHTYTHMHTLTCTHTGFTCTLENPSYILYFLWAWIPANLLI